MGVHDILEDASDDRSGLFRQALLADLRALEQLLARNAFESDIVRIGVEQEMFLVDAKHRAAPVAAQVLERLPDPAFTTEIGKFNLEANLAPHRFEAACLRSTEAELNRLVREASQAAEAYGAQVLLTGILPSVRVRDLCLNNLTDKPRYQELNRIVMGLRGGSYHLLIKGVDELQFVHDNVMPEACCTSFQVHLQLDPRRFATQYNASLLAAAPVLAAAVNSPLFLGQRLWEETRIALFQHAVDERSHSHIARRHPTRVTFGEAWVQDSVLEIYRDQVARFRVMMTTSVDENSIDIVAKGGVPRLSALVLHNGTVWRWNRPCYGITDGRAHLRLEFRALPAGPTILDEIANAAFFCGLMTSIPEQYGNVSASVAFTDVKDNFFAAARHGLKAQLTWVDGKHYPVDKFIREQLLPLAAAGLTKARIDREDIDTYLGVIRDRIEADQTGSKWTLSARASFPGPISPEYRDRCVVAGMLSRQRSGEPVHRWSLLSQAELQGIEGIPDTVAEIMSTDLVTVGPDDPITLAASMMDWRHIRHLPVEKEGVLVGLLSSRDVLHFAADRGWQLHDRNPVPVRQLMNSQPITVSPEVSILEAVNVMLQHEIHCLPVTQGNALVGVVTSHDMLVVFSSLLRREQAHRAAESRAAKLPAMNAN
jgi:CBS domain-containing protein